MTSSPSSIKLLPCLCRPSLVRGLRGSQPQTLAQAFRLGFGLPQMNLEQPLQLLRVSGFDHLGKGFRELRFGVQNVPQLLD